MKHLFYCQYLKLALLPLLSPVLSSCYIVEPLPENFQQKVLYNQPDKHKLVIIYLHGFGGARKQPAFVDNMQDFLNDHKITDCKVENFMWDSQKISPKRAGRDWVDAKEKADKTAIKLGKFINEYEKSKTPYVLVGFSLGTRVIIKTLEQEQNLKMLQQVFFMGSALPHNLQTSKKILQKNRKIINYHSIYLDSVLDKTFYFMEGIQAGGQKGFDDSKLFANYPVTCSHLWKPVISYDYSTLAEAIGYIALNQQKVTLAGSSNINIKMPVLDGDIWWNDILRVKNDSVLIQQHRDTGFYRAVDVDSDGSRTRIAWNSNLHTILKELKL